MSEGVFEKLAKALERVEGKVDALAECRAAHAEPRVASIADMAVRYSVAKSTVRELLHRMRAAGLVVETSKMGSEWRINVAQFDAAYDRLFLEEF